MTDVDLDELTERPVDMAGFVWMDGTERNWLIQEIHRLKGERDRHIELRNEVEAERDEALEALKWALNGVQEELDAMARDTENLEEVEARIQQALTSVDDQEANND